MKQTKLKDLSGGELEAALKDEAINVKPDTFIEAYNRMSMLLDVQNERARKIAKKYGVKHIERSVSDVLSYYRLAREIKNYNEA